jgi:drug/metabolite transporter (DMT)-like permease
MALGSVPLAVIVEPHPLSHVSITPFIVLVTIVVAMLWGLSDLFTFTAYKFEEASVLTSIYPLYHVIAFLVSIIFFRSQLTFMLVIGFLCIAIASFVASYQREDFHISKGMWYCLASCVSYGLALGLMPILANAFSITINLLIGYGGPLVATLLFTRPAWKEYQHELQTQWWKILILSILGVSFYVLLIFSYRGGNVPLVIVTLSLETVLTALAGIVILKERNNMKRKLLAAIIATIGVLLIQL